MVNGVWVDPKYRGTRAAILLMDSLTGWASSNGMRSMEGYVTKTNERALRFYRKCGFEITEETIILERDPSIVSVLIRKNLSANQPSQTTPASAGGAIGHNACRACNAYRTLPAQDGCSRRLTTRFRSRPLHRRTLATRPPVCFHHYRC